MISGGPGLIISPCLKLTLHGFDFAYYSLKFVIYACQQADSGNTGSDYTCSQCNSQALSDK